MPNWVENKLTITGPREERERFLNECINDEKEFDFGKLIPEPAEFPKADNRFFPDWYVWHIQHWARSGTPPTPTSMLARTNDTVFRTAWSPPMPVFDELGHRFPKLTLAGKYSEYMNGFGGEFILHEGQCDFTDRSEEVRAAYVKLCDTSNNQDPWVEDAEVPF